MDDGTYAGYHPGTSSEALAHLDALTTKGAQYILFPSTTSWWLEYYDVFAGALRGNREETLGQSDTCLIFGLTNASPEPAIHV
jgi:hypothetical protein